MLAEVGRRSCSLFPTVGLSPVQAQIPRRMWAMMLSLCASITSARSWSAFVISDIPVRVAINGDGLEFQIEVSIVAQEDVDISSLRLVERQFKNALA